VQEEVMTWFKVQAVEFYDSGETEAGSKKKNVWTMPATVLENKVM
jgi:hypothetical protein